MSKFLHAVNSLHAHMFTRPVLLTTLLASLLWLALLALLIPAGYTPDYWQLRHLEDGATLPYPTVSVAWFALSGAGVLVLLVMIARPWVFRGLWWRLLIALLPVLAWSLLWAAGAMHQPPVQGAHLLWLLLLDLALLLALLGICVVTLCKAVGRRRAQTKNAPVRERSS